MNFWPRNGPEPKGFRSGQFVAPFYRLMLPPPELTEACGWLGASELGQ